MSNIKVYGYPGRKYCGDDSLDKTIDCLCREFKKGDEVRAGTVEKRCKTEGIDHNVAFACLETLAPHIDEVDIWGGICTDKRRLIRKTLYKWWLDPPETSNDLWITGLILSSFVLNLGLLIWRIKRKGKH
jgi:hypothetical protein